MKLLSPLAVSKLQDDIACKLSNALLGTTDEEERIRIEDTIEADAQREAELDAYERFEAEGKAMASAHVPEVDLW